MIDPNIKPTDDRFISFMLKCSDFDNLEFINFKNIEPKAELYVVQSILSEKGFSNYAMKKYLFIKLNEQERFIELEDANGNYVGQFGFSDNGSPMFSLNKTTGKPDPFEKTFATYIAAAKYMQSLKFVCDVAEDVFLIKLLQKINKIDRGNNE